MKDFLKKAATCLNNREYQGAVIEFSKELGKVELIGDNTKLAEIQTFLIKALYLNHNFKLAIDVANNVKLEHLETIDSKRRFFTYLANSYIMVGNEEEAYSCYEKLSELADGRCIYNALLGKGIIIGKKKDSLQNFKESEELFVRAKKYVESKGDEVLILVNEAELKTKFGYHDEALACASFALDVADKPELKALVLNTLAMVYIELKMLSEAYNCLDESANLCLQINDNVRLGYNYKWRAKAYRLDRKYEAAISSLERAIEILKDKELLLEAAECAWELSALYENKDWALYHKYRIQAESFKKAIDFI